jgi:ABC-2 type transport system ATP-binding protein/lipopolysaccharide transport system ATP-binding protein
MVARLCRESLWLENGQIRATGGSDEIARQYLASSLAANDSGASLIRSGPLLVHGVRVTPQAGDAAGALMRHDPLCVEVDFELREEVPGLDLALYITTSTGVRVIDEVLSDTAVPRIKAGRQRARMTLPPVLNVGDYRVGIWLGTPHSELIHEPSAAAFTLHGSNEQRPERLVVLGLPITLNP